MLLLSHSAFFLKCLHSHEKEKNVRKLQSGEAKWREKYQPLLSQMADAVPNLSYTSFIHFLDSNLLIFLGHVLETNG